MPNHAHEPTEKTRSEVSALRSFGVPAADIATYIGVDKKTLYKYYRQEIDESVMKANAQVGQFLFHAASGRALKDKESGANYSDCVRAAMFWAKTRMGWRESNGIDITSGDKPLQPSEVSESIAKQIADKLTE